MSRLSINKTITPQPLPPPIALGVKARVERHPDPVHRAEWTTVQDLAPYEGKVIRKEGRLQCPAEGCDEIRWEIDLDRSGRRLWCCESQIEVLPE